MMIIVITMRAEVIVRENIPTALAIIPNKRPKSLKKILDEAGCKLFD